MPFFFQSIFYNFFPTVFPFLHNTIGHAVKSNKNKQISLTLTLTLLSKKYLSFSWVICILQSSVHKHGNSLYQWSWCLISCPITSINKSEVNLPTTRKVKISQENFSGKTLENANDATILEDQDLASFYPLFCFHPVTCQSLSGSPEYNIQKLFQRKERG